MKRFISIALFVCCLTSLGFAQDLPFFQVADNAGLGFNMDTMDRWGCSSADIDRNGWPDIYSNKWRGNVDSQIYMNYEGVFTDVWANSPDLKTAEYDGNATRTPVLVDFDNDGDRDLMLGTDSFHSMFRNDDNIFTNITDELGIVSGAPGFYSTYGYEMSAWIDWDLDGDLDALVVQTNNEDFIFYRNDGDQFVDIAADVGLAGQNELGARTDRGWDTGRIQWIDWDLDGDPDLSAGWKLFRNDDGYLNEVSEEVGFLPFKSIRFTDWFDYDLDGDFDYYVEGYENRNELWKNEGGTFVDASQETTLDLLSENGQASMNVADYDNDGDEDVFFSINDHEDIEAFIINYKDETGRYFLEVAEFCGFTLIDDRKGGAAIDYNMDGLVDIYCPTQTYGHLMYENIGPEVVNNWIGFDLWGTESNKDAIGSLVTVYAGEMKLIRYTKAARTWKVQDNAYVHFGIGQEATVDSVVIRWPLGGVQVIADPAINQYHKIVEDVGGVAVDDTDVQLPVHMVLYQNYPNPFNPVTRIEYNLSVANGVSLKIYNLQGAEIASLIDTQHQPAGQHSAMWDGKDNSGQFVATGVYIYQLRAGDYTATKKMSLMK